MDPLVPERLAAQLAGRYSLEHELGAGGMARVWRARDLRHERTVAIKVLRPELAAAVGAERFLAEIRTTAGLVHPHVLPLLDSGDAAGLLWFATPFVAGGSLRARLERERPLSVAEAVRLAREVAEGLEAAHRAGIVHRDVKPENILLQDGAALVADFGIALPPQDGRAPRMTETGLTLGTPTYMSPEQAAGDRRVDARTDVYAVGALLYEMLTGEPPHAASTAQAVIAKVLTERPTSPRVLRPDVSPPLERLVLSALAKAPGDRPTSAGALARALADPRLLDPGGAGDSRRRVVPLLVAGAALGLVVATVWALRQGDAPPAADAAPLAAAARRTQLTTTGNARSPAFSPDGLLLAVAVEECDVSRCSAALELRDPAAGTPRRLAEGYDQLLYLTFSPDGRWLLAQGSRERRYGVWVMPAAGGADRFLGCCYGSFLGTGDTVALSTFDTRPTAAPVLLVTTADGVVRDSVRARLPGEGTTIAEASPRGDLLAMVRLVDGGRVGAWLVRRSGEVADSLPGPHRFTLSGAWRWSPAGDALLWAWANPDDPRLMDWWRFPVAPATGRVAGPRQLVLRGEASSGQFAVAPNGDLVVELSSRRQLGALLELDAAGRPVARPFRTATVPFFAAMSPSGARVAVATPGTDSSLALSVVDVASGAERTITRLSRLPIAGNEWAQSLAWAGEDTLLMLQPRPDGTDELVRVALSTGNARVVAGLPGGQRTLARLPGGDVVAFGTFERRLARVHGDGTVELRTLPDSVPWSFVRGIAEDDEHLVFFTVDDRSLDYALRRFAWSTGRSERLATVPWVDGWTTLSRDAGGLRIALRGEQGRLTMLRLAPGADRLVEDTTLLRPQLALPRLRWPLLHFADDARRGVLFGLEDVPDLWKISGALAGEW